jgi:hypothetical protein
MNSAREGKYLELHSNNGAARFLKAYQRVEQGVSGIPPPDN